MENKSLLTDEHLEKFKTDGYCVVSVFDRNEIAEARRKFHSVLKHQFGINYDDLFDDSRKSVFSSYAKRGTHTELYFSPWKLDLQTDKRMWHTCRSLLHQTFGVQERHFEHPYGQWEEADGGYLYCDRVAFRPPTSVAPHIGGLPLHIDRNFYDPFHLRYEKVGLQKWRPIQVAVALTEQIGENSGGLRVVPGFHRQWDDFVEREWQTILNGPRGRDDYYLRKLCEKERFVAMGDTFEGLEQRARHVDMQPGDIVIWDNRLPHSTDDILEGDDSREQLFGTYLPPVQCNAEYAAAQLGAYRKNVAPPDFVTKKNKESPCDAKKNYRLSETGRELFGF